MSNDDPLAPLLAEYARTQDAAVRDEIVLSCMDLVEHIATRYRFAGEPVEDVIQEGYIGLINSVEMFDLNRGVKFTTYAAHAVQGAIQHYLRDKGKLIREPGWLHDLNQRINKATSLLHQRLGREPTVDEIALELNLPERQIAEAVRSRDVFRVSSLEQPPGEESDGTLAPVEREAGPADRDEDFPVVDRLALEDAIGNLREIERKVVHDFFFLGLSKTEIARKMGYSISHISHILRRALRELKEQLLTEERAVMRRQLWNIEGQLDHFVRRVREETIKDDLTGLFNRRYILDRLDEEISRGQRYGFHLSVCVLAIDGLAAFRATYGDFDADRALCTIADLLIECSRRIDCVGRYDTERFVLMLPQTGEQATVLCQRIRDRFAERRFRYEETPDAQMQAVCGIAVYPHSGSSVEELITAAENSLKAAMEDATAEAIVIDPAGRGPDG